MKISRRLPRFAVATVTLVAISVITYAASFDNSSQYLDSVREFFGIAPVQAISTVERPETAKALPTPRRLAVSASQIWNNTGTDFNAAAPWGGTALATGDTAVFNSGAITQPALDASISLALVNFQASASGYDITGSSTNKLTLTATSSGTTTSAISSQITSGTNAIDAPVVLGASTTQTFSQSGSGGTLILNGVISSVNSPTLSFGSVGTFNINGANTYTGNTSQAAGSLMVVGNKTAFGTGRYIFASNANRIKAGIDLTGANKLTNPITWGTNATINDSGTFGIEFGGDVDLGGGVRTINSSISGGATFDGIVSNDNGGGLSIITTSGSLVTLKGINTYTGSTTISGTGKLSVSSIGNIGDSGNIGAGTTIVLGNGTSAGTLIYTGSGETTDRIVNLAGTTGGATIDQSGTGLLKFSTTNIQLGGGAKTFTLQGSTTGTGEIAGDIKDNSGANKTSLVKTGSGAWTLSGGNDYTGPTTINGGTLFVTGFTAPESAVAVNSSTILAGTGAVLGQLTVKNGGTLAPGFSPGIFNIGNAFNQGSVIFNSGSTFAVEIGGITAGNTPTSYDQLNVLGTVNLGGSTLSLTSFGGFVPSAGQTFTIVNNDGADPITGTFSGLAQGAVISNFLSSGLNATISYAGGTGNDVVITVLAAPPAVNLSVSFNLGSEAAATAIAVTATASTAVTGNQTVDLTVTGAGITAGDYTLSPATITILNGQTTGTATFTVVDDSVYEGPETATITESNPSAGITLGATTSQDIAITDNDNPPGTLVVTNTSDNAGVCLPGDCSLRQAITSANANADATTIDFAIPGGGVQTIAPLTPLPTITQQVTVDGYSQPLATANTLASGDNANILIELDGENLAFPASGIQIQASNSVVKGLVINRFPNVNVLIASGTGNHVEGNFIGLDQTGTTRLFTSVDGVFIADDANFIGGSTAAARNVIAGNNAREVFLSSSGNVVAGNYIGTNSAGAARPINGSPGQGISLIGSSNTIGGLTPNERNVISGNESNGISVGGFTATPSTLNVISGNYIGVDATGTLRVANDGQGILLQGGVTANMIGVPGAGNVISGNGLDFGSNIFSGIWLNEDASGTPASNIIQSNYIGTDATGTVAIANRDSGVRITNSPNNIVGGATAAERNVISGNFRRGVFIEVSNATGNAIKGNYIGVGADGTTAVGNGDIGGVFISSTAAGNTIGGTAAGEGNVIANNTGPGIRDDEFGGGNAYRGNSIDSNGGLGIDIDVSGVTANDAGDADVNAGGDPVQNYPVLSAAINTGTASDLAGSLNSTANTTFDVDIYASPACDGSGFGEGRTLLGSTSVLSDSGGDVNFDITAITLPFGQFITATATGPTGATSEFSGCMQVIGGTPGVVQFSSPTYSVGESGGQVTITVTRVGGSDGPIGVNYSTSNGTAIGGALCDGTADFINSSGTINFADGDTIDKTFDVPICEDTEVEGDQNFAVILASGPFATVTIIDNDVVPAALTVNSPADTDDGSCTADANGCTLREAINAANSNADANTITFSGVSSIQLSSALPGISTTMSVVGGSGITISGDAANNTFRAFSIASTGNLTMSNITVTNAKEILGGGLLNVNGGTVSMTNCTFTFNIATTTAGGAIFNDGLMTLDNVVVSFNSAKTEGDGIRNGANGVMTLTESTVSLNGNSGQPSVIGGGGIDNAGTLTVDRSNIYGNLTGGNGGGIFNLTGTVNLTNSTVAFNSAFANNGGGIYNDLTGTITITNSTITDANQAVIGGGIYNNATVNLKNSIVAGNNGALAPDVFGAYAAPMFDLIGKSDGSTGFVNAVNGNIVGTAATPVDPMLESIANNGGPTQTYALMSGSPAANTGNIALAVDPVTLTPLATDQRGVGFSRIIGGRVDIGSFESPFVPTAAPASISGQVRTRNGSGLRNAYITVSGGNLNQPIMAATSSFGYFQVNGLTAGQAYVVSVSSRRYSFTPAVRALQLFEDVAGYDFIADQ